MAFTFASKPVATVKATKKDGDGASISMGGINATVTSVDNTVAQMNKILTVGGQAVVADASAKKTLTEEAINNG